MLNAFGHHDGEFDMNGRRILQEIKCTGETDFKSLHENRPDMAWLRARFVGIKLRDQAAFHPFLNMLRDYLAGMSIPELKNAYDADMRDLTFHISTVGAIIDAARHNTTTSAALSAAGVRVRVPGGRGSGGRLHPSMIEHMGYLRAGEVRSWGIEWAGHQVFDGAAALDPANGLF